MTAARPTALTRLRHFPFPFPTDSYRYSTNVEPARTPTVTDAGAWGDRVLHVDDHYGAELASRAAILRSDPSRLQVLPHMRPAAWDAMVAMLAELADAHPAWFTLVMDGPRGVWTNRLLGIEQTFTDGDDESVPGGPLGFLGSQIQEDVVLLDQRENSLWADAGLVTFAADWSMGFDTGMRFLEVHGPVPRVHEEGIIARAERFLMRLQPGEQYRRTNWTMSAGRLLDQSTETYPIWGPARQAILQTDDDEFARQLHLRVEVQHLLRLGDSGAICFLIRTYLAAIADIAGVPAWGRRLGHVLRELPEDMADYKGIARYRHAAADWLLAQ